MAFPTSRFSKEPESSVSTDERHYGSPCPARRLNKCQPPQQTYTSRYIRTFADYESTLAKEVASRRGQHAQLKNKLDILTVGTTWRLWYLTSVWTKVRHDSIHALM